MKLEELFKDTLSLEEQSNENLFELAFAGDEEALVQLYNSTYRLWFKLCRNMHDGNYSSSFEDWLSVCKIEFFEKWKSYIPEKEGGSKFSTFIFVVIRNKLVNEIRRIQSNKSMAMYNPMRLDNSEENTELAIAFHMYDDSEFSECLLNDFVELVRKETTPRIYAVMLLKLIDGKSLKVIADELGVSRQVISGHYKIIRQLIKTFVAQRVPSYV